MNANQAAFPTATMARVLGVSESTPDGGCQLVWIELEMSLQYGDTVRGAAASTLCWKSSSRSSG